MKKMDLKKWENYRGLPTEQEEELYEIFMKTMRSMDIGSYHEAVEYFSSGTDTLANFLVIMENTKWFDYTQMNEIFQEISLYLEQIKDDQEDIE